MDPWPRFATLDAVLLGVLAIATSLPFVADDASPLWSAPPTGHAAATKFAVMFLLAVLIWGAIVARRLWPALVKTVAAVLTGLAVLTGADLGSGGTLIAMTALLAALSGIGAVVTAATGLTPRSAPTDAESAPRPPGTATAGS